MSDTHPNAFREEAAQKRAVAESLLSEADALDAQAEALDPTPVEETEAVEEAVEPAVEETAAPATDAPVADVADVAKGAK